MSNDFSYATVTVPVGSIVLRDHEALTVHMKTRDGGMCQVELAVTDDGPRVCAKRENLGIVKAFDEVYG